MCPFQQFTGPKHYDKGTKHLLIKNLRSLKNSLIKSQTVHPPKNTIHRLPPHQIKRSCYKSLNKTSPRWQLCWPGVQGPGPPHPEIKTVQPVEPSGDNHPKNLTSLNLGKLRRWFLHTGETMPEQKGY